MLKDNLARKMTEKGEGFRCSVLARKAGVLHETVLKIFRGETKNPGVYTLTKIADALNCSIDELTGHHSAAAPLPNIIMENDKLLLEIITFVFKKIENRSHDVYLLDFFKTVLNIYSYSKEKKEIDKKFGGWCIETYLLKTN
jgi:transcriptional regulator with XRE-family HTH domain